MHAAITMGVNALGSALSVAARWKLECLSVVFVDPARAANVEIRDTRDRYNVWPRTARGLVIFVGSGLKGSS